MEFYVVGGTLRRDALSYIQRRADDDLIEALKEHQFCYVLTSRQMGKSSLMVRTAGKLREQGISVVVLDLTRLGQNVSAEQWYRGIIEGIGEQLKIEKQLETYWDDHEKRPPLNRLLSAIAEVVLPLHKGHIVIFMDEIDSLRSLPFSTDELFAGIRELHNRRAANPEFERITFCLLGVATPSDLIKDSRTTPFNIGRRIELTDFAEEEGWPLVTGLGRDTETGRKLLKRIFYWTGGHPYLTQRLCQAVANDRSLKSSRGVDRICEDLFLSSRAKEKDDNLLFVRDRILRSEVDRATLLDLYAKVRAKKSVADDEGNPTIDVLRLSGVTRVQQGYLQVRNRIYHRAFDKNWVIANMPDAEIRRQKVAFRNGLLRAAFITIPVLVLISILAIAFLSQRDEARTQAEENRKIVEKLRKAEMEHKRIDQDEAYERELATEARQGNRDSEYRLASQLYGQRRYSDALPWLNRLAEYGHPHAMELLGKVLLYGQGTNKDYKAAKNYLLKATRKGDAAAAFDLGTIYARGWGVKADPAEALVWYRRAANADNQLAKSFADALCEGQHLPTDYLEAAEWYRKAAFAGRQDAADSLGALYLDRKVSPSLGFVFVNGIPTPTANEFPMFQAFAKKGDLAASAVVAWMYENGIGISQDYSAATLLYKDVSAAPNLNRARGMNHLAAMYEEGRGVDQDYKAAFDLYLQSAALGNTAAMAKLADFYGQGFGRDRDEKEAQKWLDKALATSAQDNAAQWWKNLAMPHDGQQAHLAQDTKYLVVYGMKDQQLWYLRYSRPYDAKATLVTASEHRAYFSDGLWLRLIDSANGVVLGRWKFPRSIIEIHPIANSLRVKLVLSQKDIGTGITFNFDPSSPSIPQWGAETLLDLNTARREVEDASLSTDKFSPPKPNLADDIPELQALSRGDPFTPWFQFGLGRVYRALGQQADARVAFNAAISKQSADFTELLQMAGILHQIEEHDLAHQAFEAGYAKYLQAGFDPRMNWMLLTRLVLFAPISNYPTNVPLDERIQIEEELYRLAPYNEGGFYAWRIWAKFLDNMGRKHDSKIWSNRALENDRYTFGWSSRFARLIDFTLPVVMIGTPAFFFYYLLVCTSHAWMNKDRIKLEKKWKRLIKELSCLTMPHWTPEQRFGLAAALLILWLANGLLIQSGAVIGRMVRIPIAATGGSLASPTTRAYLASLPRSPERELLTAINIQQDGDRIAAERIYRGLPQFAEAWNNLGVLLKEDGREAEAEMAFKQALLLQPDLDEANYNLGRQPGSVWVQAFAKAAPGRPMIAPPQHDHAFLAVRGPISSLAFRMLGGPLYTLVRFAGADCFSTAECDVFAIIERLSDSGMQSMPDPSDVRVSVVLDIMLLLPAAALLCSLFQKQKPIERKFNKEIIATELLFPGITPRTHVFGAIIFIAWACSLFELLLYRNWYLVYLFSSLAVPNLVRTYGVPVENVWLELGLRPAALSVYLPVVVLFSINVLLVFHEYRRLRPVSSKDAQAKAAMAV